jgi:catalase
MEVPKGRVNYEPNSFDGGAPRENPTRGFTRFPEAIDDTKIRKRAETFADHYSQARMFFRSMTEPEQRHIISAFAFELAKIETKAIRTRMLGHLAIIDSTLHSGVEEALGMAGLADRITPAVPPRDLSPSPALSLLGKAPATLKGRKIGVLLSDGFDAALLAALRAGAKAEKATLSVVAPKVGGVKDSAGNSLEADGALTGSPSVFFDAVVLLSSESGVQSLLPQPATIDWLANAFNHLKVIAFTPQSQPILDKANVVPDIGLIPLTNAKSVATFIKLAKRGRVWERERP